MLTPRQEEVIASITSVRLKPYKLKVRGPLPRYELHGRECTMQIHSLVLANLIIEGPCGSFRLSDDKSRSSETPIFYEPPPPLEAASQACEPVAPIADDDIAPQNTQDEAPSPSNVALMMDFLCAPVSVHRDPNSASARASRSGYQGDQLKPWNANRRAAATERP